MRHAEVGNLDGGRRRAEDVCGLDVAVDDTFGVGIAEREQELRHDLADLPDGEERARRITLSKVPFTYSMTM